MAKKHLALVARFLCWHFQEQAGGGLDPETAKHLDGLARGDKRGADRPRRLKPGTVLLREYQGERHTVTVVPNGYLWRETTYASLSTIARAITPIPRLPPDMKIVLPARLICVPPVTARTVDQGVWRSDRSGGRQDDRGLSQAELWGLKRFPG